MAHTRFPLLPSVAARAFTFVGPFFKLLLGGVLTQNPDPSLMISHDFAAFSVVYVFA